MKYKKAAFGEFIRAISQMPERLKMFLTKYTDMEYAELGAVAYLSEDKRSGYAITKNYDLISVFSLPGARQGNAAMEDAIRNGARTLDCFDGFLPDFYRQYGFIEYKRVTWNDRYAPQEWNNEEFGSPDIVYMKRIRGKKPTRIFNI